MIDPGSTLGQGYNIVQKEYFLAKTNKELNIRKLFESILWSHWKELFYDSDRKAEKIHQDNYKDKFPYIDEQRKLHFNTNYPYDPKSYGTVEDQELFDYIMNSTKRVQDFNEKDMR